MRKPASLGAFSRFGYWGCRMKDRFCKRCKNTGGFTLLDTLLAVVILIVLLAVSVVGILAFLRQMQITDLDNAAREIYLAA